MPGRGSWNIVAATARGGAHEQLGTPNQDSHAFQCVENDHNRWVVAVADGHGGRRYIRSRRGAELATGLATRIGLQLLRERHERSEHRTGELIERLLPVWRKAVLDDIAARPFTAADAEQAGVDPRKQPLLAYGSTLLLALTDGPAVAFAQVGDGDIVVRTAARVLHPVPGDPRLVAGTTTSLGLPTAESDCRHAVVDAARGADLVLLATDGYGNAFADRRWPHLVMGDLADQLETSGTAEVAGALPGWLSQSARVGGDDVTVALMVRVRP